MARTRNETQFNEARQRLLTLGEDLIRSRSYADVGINDVLKTAGIPKGSFYHYFDSKQDFALAVAQHYHNKQLAAAKAVLHSAREPAAARLKRFFQTALNDYRARGFRQGCLMCNLTTELADEALVFNQLLQNQFAELSAVIAGCLHDIDLNTLGLDHLTNDQAADWLLNAWSGALTRMKATQDSTPLDLFMKSVFKGEG